MYLDMVFRVIIKSCIIKFIVCRIWKLYWECFWRRDWWIVWVGCVVKIRFIVCFFSVLKSFWGDFLSCFIRWCNVFFIFDFVKVLFLFLMLFFLVFEICCCRVIWIFLVKFLRLSMCENEFVIIMLFLGFRLFSMFVSCWSFCMFFVLFVLEYNLDNLYKFWICSEGEYIVRIELLIFGCILWL